MPKSRPRRRAAAKAAAGRRNQQGQPRVTPGLQLTMPDRSVPDSPETWLASVEAALGPLSDEDAVWMEGKAAALRQDPDGMHEFAAAPWSVWLDARAAGDSPEALAVLAHHRFAFHYHLGQWITEAMTLSELIAGAMPDAIVSPSADTSIAEAIASLAGEDVLLWDQASQTATPGPRTLAAESAEDAEFFQRFGHY